MEYLVSDAARIVGGKLYGNPDLIVRQICTDSRRMSSAHCTMFAAIASTHNDGHRYATAMYERGVRIFLVHQSAQLPADIVNDHSAAIIAVDSTMCALQALAAHHRAQYAYPVVGITGSNGKTIVKEWTTRLLMKQINVVRSPKSYNSQLGVALSTLQMTEDAQCAILEAGISMPNEMERLEKIIRPTIALITNVGEAHSAGFASRAQKMTEKLKICTSADIIICCEDHIDICENIHTSTALRNKTLLTWGKSPQASIQVTKCENHQNYTEVIVDTSNLRQLRLQSSEKKSHHRVMDAHSVVKTTITPPSDTFSLHIPFIDAASVENILHAFALCMALRMHCPRLNIDIASIATDISNLSPVAMRLELHKGIGNCVIVNDAYSADLESLRIALDFLCSCSAHNKYTAILSDFEQSSSDAWRLYSAIDAILMEKGITTLIGIGQDICRNSQHFHCRKEFYTSVDNFLMRHDITSFQQEAILIKGSRSYGLERICEKLQRHTHITTLDVNLSALSDNLNTARTIIAPPIKILTLVKANAYGAGLCETARFLEQRRVDYLGVAFADEGVTLREAGITLPILALNPEYGTFDKMITYRLEPELYSEEVFHRFCEAVTRAGEQNYPVHIKLDTGMHRLGFMSTEKDKLLQCLHDARGIVRVAGVFTHFAAADEAAYDDFTHRQISLFNAWSNEIVDALGYGVIRHAANSWGAVRFHNAHLDMIRLGAGLYGITDGDSNPFRSVCTLKSALVQVKNIKQGETVGYVCRFTAQHNVTIGIIPVGYADGLDRKLGNGCGKVMINGSEAAIIGNVCMDMCMVNLTGINAKEGDEVVLFGDNPTIVSVANALGTISYEILARISQRVKRVYYFE
jgi:alanine racemase